MSSTESTPTKKPGQAKASRPKRVTTPDETSTPSARGQSKFSSPLYLGDLTGHSGSSMENHGGQSSLSADVRAPIRNMRQVIEAGKKKEREMQQMQKQQKQNQRKAELSDSEDGIFKTQDDIDDECLRKFEEGEDRDSESHIRSQDTKAEGTVDYQARFDIDEHESLEEYLKAGKGEEKARGLFSPFSYSDSSALGPIENPKTPSGPNGANSPIGNPRKKVKVNFLKESTINYGIDMSSPTPMPGTMRALKQKAALKPLFPTKNNLATSSALSSPINSDGSLTPVKTPIAQETPFVLYEIPAGFESDLDVDNMKIGMIHPAFSLDEQREMAIREANVSEEKDWETPFLASLEVVKDSRWVNSNYEVVRSRDSERYKEWRKKLNIRCNRARIIENFVKGGVKGVLRHVGRRPPQDYGDVKQMIERLVKSRAEGPGQGTKLTHPAITDPLDGTDPSGYYAAARAAKQAGPVSYRHKKGNPIAKKGLSFREFRSRQESIDTAIDLQRVDFTAAEAFKDTLRPVTEEERVELLDSKVFRNYIKEKSEWARGIPSAILKEKARIMEKKRKWEGENNDAERSSLMKEVQLAKQEKQQAQQQRNHHQNRGKATTLKKVTGDFSTMTCEEDSEKPIPGSSASSTSNAGEQNEGINEERWGHVLMELEADGVRRKRPSLDGLWPTIAPRTSSASVLAYAAAAARNTKPYQNTRASSTQLASSISSIRKPKHRMAGEKTSVFTFSESDLAGWSPLKRALAENIKYFKAIGRSDTWILNQWCDLVYTEDWMDGLKQPDSHQALEDAVIEIFDHCIEKHRSDVQGSPESLPQSTVDKGYRRDDLTTPRG